MSVYHALLVGLVVVPLCFQCTALLATNLITATETNLGLLDGQLGYNMGILFIEFGWLVLPSDPAVSVAFPSLPAPSRSFANLCNAVQFSTILSTSPVLDHAFFCGPASSWFKIQFLQCAAVVLLGLVVLLLVQLICLPHFLQSKAVTVAVIAALFTVYLATQTAALALIAQAITGKSAKRPNALTFGIGFLLLCVGYVFNLLSVILFLHLELQKKSISSQKISIV
ncbi:hypothetical protein HDU91_003206 [Kappamyces sp. JEL0680]|nr:hypothetical protein HDU91_003206 [Kappamyces sp. JEL0680]